MLRTSYGVSEPIREGRIKRGARLLPLNPVINKLVNPGLVVAYILWLAYFSYANREASWLWLFTAGLALGFGGSVLLRFKRLAEQSKEIATFARGTVVLGLSVAGMVVSADVALARGILVGMAGPAYLAWTADRVARARQEHDRLEAENWRLRTELALLERTRSIEEGVSTVTEGITSLHKGVTGTIQMIALDRAMQPSGRRVAGRRRRRPSQIMVLQTPADRRASDGGDGPGSAARSG